MKTILLDGDLILRGLTDEGDFHQHFVVLWQTLQSSKLEGYITELDLARLHRRLENEIGYEASQRLLSAFRRILKIFSSDPCGWIDAIITENPQSFNEWDIPIFSVTEFLQRYELDSLLKQTSEAIPPLTKIPDLPNHKTNKAATTMLLMVPILLELWMRREQVTGVLAALNQNENEQAYAEEPLKLGLATHSSQAISVVDSEVIPTVETRSPLARLLLSDLPGIDISVENDVALDVQLDSQGNTVIIRLQLPQNPPSMGNAIAATLYRSDDGQAIAQAVMTETGLVVVANPAQAFSRSVSGVNGSDDPVIALVQQTPDGHLTAWLNAQSSPSTGDRTAISAPFTRDAVVAVRSTDRYPSLGLTPGQRGLEIRIDVKPDGNHTVTISPQPFQMPRIDNSESGLGGGGGIESHNGQPPNLQPNGVENYDSSWVLNNNSNTSNFLPDTAPPPPSSESGQSFNEGGTGRTAPDRPYGLFVEPFIDPNVAVIQIADSTGAGQADRLSSGSLLTQDDLLGRSERTVAMTIPDELLAGDTSISIAANATLTISSRNPGEIGSTNPIQSNSTLLSVFSNSAAFPNYFTTTFDNWLSTTEISGI